MEKNLTAKFIDTDVETTEIAKYKVSEKDTVVYIASAKIGAQLELGIKEDVSEKTFSYAVAQNCIENVVKKVTVKTGEVFFLPKGIIFSFGKGIKAYIVSSGKILDFDENADINVKTKTKKYFPNEQGDIRVNDPQDFYTLKTILKRKRINISGVYCTCTCTSSFFKIFNEESTKTIYSGETVYLSANEEYKLYAEYGEVIISVLK